MPSWTSPSSQPTAGTPCWPNVSSQVADPLRPILCSRLVTNAPLRSPGAPVSGSKRNLGTRNSDSPLVPGRGVIPGPSGRASTRCMMFSVTSWSAEVMNRFTPSRCQVPSACCTALVRPAPTSEPASGSVSTIVAPQPRSIMISAQRCCSRRAVAVDDGREAGARQVHERGRVGAQDQLGRRPLHARRDAVAAQLDGQPEAPPLAFPEQLVGVLQRLRQRDGVGGGVEDGRVAVGVGERGGERADGHAVELAEGVARGVEVDAVEGRRSPAVPARGRPRRG